MSQLSTYKGPRWSLHFERSSVPASFKSVLLLQPVYIRERGCSCIGVDEHPRTTGPALMLSPLGLWAVRHLCMAR